VEKAGILGDGEKWTCGIAEERFPGATQIVDLYQRESIRGDIRFHFR